MKSRYFRTVILFFLFTLTFWLSGCLNNDDSSAPTGGNTNPTSTITGSYTSGTAEGSTEKGANPDDLVESSTFSNSVSIVFGATVSITNPLENAGVNIVVTGADVVVTSTAQAVEYVLSGTTNDGSFKIYSDNKFKLTLNGVSISNYDGPAINIQSAKRAFVVLTDNTLNSLSDGSSYAASTEDMKGAFFSEGQLIFSGNGSLSVRGNRSHAIASDDYVRVRSGLITVPGAIKDGIHTNDAFIADGGTFTITASGNGIECEGGYIIINDGTFTLTTTDDSITASYGGTDTSVDPYVNINGGTISIASTEGEGIESKSALTINNGNFEIKTTDDGLNAGKALNINGGQIYIISSKNDAIDSNGTVTITGGRTVAIGAEAPEAGIDCDAHQLKITGGLLVAIGGASSLPTASVSIVPSLVMGSGSINQIIHIEAADGTEALTFLIPMSYDTMLVAGSKFKLGTTYTIFTGGSVANSTDFHGLYNSGTYTKGSSVITFSLTSIVTSLGGTTSNN